MTKKCRAIGNAWPATSSLERHENTRFSSFMDLTNGKTTFIETIRNILGDYATTVPLHSLMAKKTDQIPADIAKLKGARLAVATETESGRAFDDAKLKWLTGGDKLSARYLYRNFFDFDPEFKLVISGNHKPVIQVVDDGIGRRLHVIPFTVKIANPDKSFREMLRYEWPGILQWMMEGCLQWQERGLDPPDRVRSETEQYLEERDLVQQWIDENCITGEGEYTGTTALYSDWKSWCELRGESACTHKQFVQRLRALGYRTGQVGHDKKRVINGISLSKRACVK
jgi:putative DNA primase/helicase